MRRRLLDDWRDEFIIELRVRGVTGERIGAALAEVDTHCADSGESAAEAFGSPRDYAAARGATTDTVSTRRRTALATAGALGVLTGVLCLLSGVSGLVHHMPAAISRGDLVMLVAMLALTAVTPALLPHLRRPAVAVPYTLLVGAAMSAASVWRQVIAHVPALPLVVTGLGLLLAVRLAIRADRVLDPRTGREPFRLPRLASWWFEIALVVALVFAIVLPPTR